MPRTFNQDNKLMQAIQQARNVFLLAALLVFAGMLSACTSTASTPVIPAPTEAPSVEQTPTLTASPTPTEKPTITPTDKPTEVVIPDQLREYHELGYHDMNDGKNLYVS